MLEQPTDAIVTTHSLSEDAHTRPHEMINIAKAGSAIVNLVTIIASGRQVIVVEQRRPCQKKSTPNLNETHSNSAGGQASKVGS